jgi:farnesyl diphosphate synthase
LTRIGNSGKPGSHLLARLVMSSDPSPASADPSMTHPSGFEEAIAAVAEAVEREIDRVLSDHPEAGELARPSRLLGAMRYATLGGGKRLRPFLLVEAARACGGDAAGALRAGTALELIHCYSLVHDDLPAMDNDDLRRGRPTVHKAFDEATAILVGDALLTLAFDVMASEAVHPDPAVRLALVSGLARASGLGGMAGGQALDLEAEGRHSADGRPLALGIDDIRTLQAMKTGALIAFAVEAGARLAGAPPEQSEALRRYGRALGAAFQIADDILDVEADAAMMGKATGKDAEAGKATLLGILGLEAAKAERDRLTNAALAALEGFGDDADLLRAAAWFTARRRQ